MLPTKLFLKAFAPTILFTALLVLPNAALAHCDGMDGPVVKAAQRALEIGNVNLVLIWVQKQDELEVRRAFERTLAVRTLSPEAKELADRYFFETLVRLHRAGEGAPYTGLKPAGRDLGPAIPAADRALEEGSIEPLVTLLTSSVKEVSSNNSSKRLRRRVSAAITSRPVKSTRKLTSHSSIMLSVCTTLRSIRRMGITKTPRLRKPTKRHEPGRLAPIRIGPAVNVPGTCYAAAFDTLLSEKSRGDSSGTGNWAATTVPLAPEVISKLPPS